MKKINKKTSGKIIYGTMGGFLGASFLVASLNDGPRVTVKINKPKKEETKPVIEEVKIDYSYLTFDTNTMMYKVDLNKYIALKLGYNEKQINNSDFRNYINKIYDALGEDLYLKERDSYTLCSLETDTVVDFKKDILREIAIDIRTNETDISYKIEVDENGKTHYMSKSIYDNNTNISNKNYVSYWLSHDEFTRSFSYNDESKEYFIIQIHNGSLIDPYKLVFRSDLGEATINLNKKQYNELHEIMVSYQDTDDFISFLRDNTDIINYYLDLVKRENEEIYNHMCKLINKYLETSKKLQYN